MATKILIIDDDIDLCRLLEKLLTKNGYLVSAAYNGRSALKIYKSEKHDLVICDNRLGDMDALKLITSLRAFDENAKVMIMTGYADIKSAINLMKEGALDYVEKPLIPEDIIEKIKALLGDNKTSVIHPAHKSPQHQPGEINFYKGLSDPAKKMEEQCELVAQTPYNVILNGESGTGKEVMARAIHEMSNRASKAFVAIDCGTLSKELAASELFGHIKGAFTGAFGDKEGYFEVAEGGTLFLDEIGNLPGEVQAILLRVLQERKYKRVGGTSELPADVRIIVASNEDLKEAFTKGRFREDLYHRLNEFAITVPPLRKRKEDILPLAYFFLAKCYFETGKLVNKIEKEVEDAFLQYHWPGNIRELRNVMRRAALLTQEHEPIGRLAIIPEILQSPPAYEESDTHIITTEDSLLPDNEMADLKNAATHAEYNVIMSVLKKLKFNKKKAAEYLKIDRKTLYNKLKTFQTINQKDTASI